MKDEIKKEKPQFHIITCGTSILSNYNYNRSEESKINLDFIKSLDDSKHDWLEIINKFFEFLKQNPERNSAEINSLSYFLKEGKVKKIYLICTDTNAGKLCANTLQKYFRNELKISDINFKEARGFGTEDFEKGLLEIRDTILRLIRRHENSHEIYLNATGGFKPESAMMVLLGSLYQLPVYYLYETSRKLVVIPPFPLLYIEEIYIEILQKLIDKPGGIRINREVKKFEEAYGGKLKYLEKVGAIGIKKRKDGSKTYFIRPGGRFLYDFKTKTE